MTAELSYHKGRIPNYDEISKMEGKLMMITLLGCNNKPVAINSDHIIDINENPLHEGEILINLINGTSVPIPHMSIEEVVAKINVTTNIDKLGQMTTAICDKISHLEDSMAAGLRYVGKSCH